MEFVTNAEQETEQNSCNGKNNSVLIMDKRLNPIEECGGKNAVGNGMGGLIKADNLRQPDKITRLMGQIKNRPHDNCHGDESQIMSHFLQFKRAGLYSEACSWSTWTLSSSSEEYLFFMRLIAALIGWVG